MRRRSWPRGAVAVGLAIAAGCAAGGGRAARVDVPRTPQSAAGPVSIVQLGDSIAAGEGTYYGYVYDPTKGEWTGGDLNVSWDPPYHGCHDAKYAYVRRIAELLPVPPKVTQFACTGASFVNGISGPELSGGAPLRPAQFGNQDTGQDLNAEYDAARPDLVLVTLGADDLQFVHVVEDCIYNGYKHYFHLATLTCVQGNRGPTINQDVFGALPALKRHYETIARWIEARARARGVSTPKVVFTTYPDPLPPGGGPDSCRDANWLYPAQVRYLSSLVGTLNHAITTTVDGLRRQQSNVALADVSGAYNAAGENHRWCSADPWAYGLSIFQIAHPSSFESQAPFHPTPQGQDSIADFVLPTILKLFPGVPAPSPPTSSGVTTTSKPGG